ncbi:MAG TPA: mannose-1-phosphate guanylyltransferase [Sphingomicrobium sp.]|nr:mannose-1-phosphate guanylyltransferase [Sphingomicrobium sp.]
MVNVGGLDPNKEQAGDGPGERRAEGAGQLITPVILSGGSGTRLWPLSTADRPKQFLALGGDETLFRQTLARVEDRRRYAAPIIVANADHRTLCASELGNCENARLILEPCARNTAAAIVMAAEVARQSSGSDAMLLVMPSDQLIGDPAAFHRAVEIGQVAANAGRIVTFGITPTGPETGFGYLEAGAALGDAAGAFDVAKFVEKPELEVAETMVASGRHFWNGGIFLFRASDFLSEAQRLVPEIHQSAVQAIAGAETQGQCILPSPAPLDPCPSLSVDYAVMERSDRVAMVPLDANWSDVGSWDSLAEIEAGKQGQHATAVNSNNCYVRSDRIKVALLGVDDLVVVASGDHLLVMRKGHSQNIRQLVAQVMADTISS